MVDVDAAARKVEGSENAGGEIVALNRMSRCELRHDTTHTGTYVVILRSKDQS